MIARPRRILDRAPACTRPLVQFFAPAKTLVEVTSVIQQVKFGLNELAKCPYYGLGLLPC